MILASFGCSLTWGTELSDLTGDPKLSQYLNFSRLTWPALVAQKLGMDYWCFARGGQGNLAMADQVLQKHHAHPGYLLVINWTFIDRFDFSNRQGRHFNNGETGYSTLIPTDDQDLASFYYRHFHSEYKDKLTNLMLIKAVIDTLLEKRTRFLMTAVDPLLFCDKWHAPPQITNLQAYIRPYIRDFDGLTFVEWAKHKGFAIGRANHPLEDAHAAAADLMLPVIDSILHKA